MLSLSALKQHVQHKGRITLAELGIMVNEDNDTVQCMMQHLVKKGYVRECRLTVKCGTKCLQCSPSQTIFYQWQHETAR